MNFSKAKLIISAASPKQFPETPQVELVCVGKSNVGKSTLINGLARRKNLAYVGQRPGKTRLVNFYEFSPTLMVVDVPGYGYAKRSAKEQIQYANLMESYFSDRQQLKAMMVIIDVRRDLSEEDEMMLELAKQKGLACCVIVSKSDKVSYSKLKQKMMQLQKQTGYPVYSFSENSEADFNLILNQVKIWLQL